MEFYSHLHLISRVVLSPTLMNLKLSFPLLWLLLSGQYLVAQTADAQASSYRDLIVVKNQIWALTNSNHIKVYKSDGSETKTPSLEGITAQLIANNGNNVVAQVGTHIQRWNNTDSTWQTLGKLPATAFGLVVNSKQQIFAITDKGVFDATKGETLLPTSSPNNQLTKLTSFSKPTAYFLDKEDNIWIGFGYGEWGGNIFTYDTQHHKFVNLRFNKFEIALHPIKSFFQLKSNVGVSSGLQHMMNSGAIVEFNNFDARLIYNTWSDRDTSKAERTFTPRNIPYIGPAVYDSETDHIYFYSSLGVFKGKYGTDLSRITNWKMVFKPTLHWRNGQPDAVGSPMNVLKMLSLGSGKLVLLTQNDGVGFWDSQTFKLIP